MYVRFRLDLKKGESMSENQRFVWSKVLNAIIVAVGTIINVIFGGGIG